MINLGCQVYCRNRRGQYGDKGDSNGFSEAEEEKWLEWVACIKTVRSLSDFFFLFFSADESVSVFLSEVLDTDGCGCIAVNVNEI